MRRFLVFLFVLYLLVLFKLLFFKITLTYSDISIAGNHSTSFQTLLEHSNFTPFFRIHYYLSGEEPYLVGALNLAGNVLLFVPMGFFLAFFYRSINTGLRIATVAALISLLVEISQLLSATGEFDIDDVLLNTAGAWVGYGCYCLFRRMIRRDANTSPIAKRNAGLGRK